MLNKRIIGENFSRAAQNYEAVALVQQQAAKKLCHLASPFIRDDLRILDLGSGTGFVSRSLNNLQNRPRNILTPYSPLLSPHSPLVTPHLLRGPLVFEADLSLSMLQQHPSNFKINCDFENLPFRNHSFDILISSFSLQWLSDFEKNFLQFSALLKPHGIFAFCIPTDKSLEEAFNFFCMEIQPKMQPFADALNKKLIACPFTKELDQAQYFTYLRSVQKSIDLFRTENIAIQAELSVLQQQYGTIAGKMTIQHEGQEYTLQQAAQFFQWDHCGRTRTQNEIIMHHQLTCVFFT